MEPKEMGHSVLMYHAEDIRLIHGAKSRICKCMQYPEPIRVKDTACIENSREVNEVNEIDDQSFVYFLPLALSFSDEQATFRRASEAILLTKLSVAPCV